MTHSYVCHDSFICMTWLIPMCAMTHSCVFHDSFMCVPWLIPMYVRTHSCVCHDSFLCAPWLIIIYATMYSYVCHESFIWVSWRIHVCQDSFLCAPWLIHMCAMTQSHVCNVSSKYGIKVKSHHHLCKCFIKVCLESPKCIIAICACHRTLSTGSICPFFSCPPIRVCIKLHMYIHAHLCLVNPPPSQART